MERRHDIVLHIPESISLGDLGGSSELLDDHDEGQEVDKEDEAHWGSKGNVEGGILDPTSRKWVKIFSGFSYYFAESHPLR